MSELSAGRDLDIAVCRDVLGWTNFRTRTNGCLIGKPPHGISRVPLKVSTDFGLAWEHVKEALRTKGLLVRVQEMPDGVPFIGGAGMRGEESIPIHHRAACMLYAPAGTRELKWWPLGGVMAFGSDAAEALCRAALRAHWCQERWGDE